MSFKQVPTPKLIFEKSKVGHVGCNFPVADTPEVDLNTCLGDLRKKLELPEVSELECMRHFVNLSQLNYGIETGVYPLGSCTMKYNPRINEKIAAFLGFTHLHPLQPSFQVQGALEVMMLLQEILSEITGFDAVSLQPLAGAHGEMTCLMLIKAYFESKKEYRKWVLIPDSAHGTNPASAALCGFEVKSIPTGLSGGVDLNRFKELLNDNVAAIMLTNPSTLGLFEINIQEIDKLAHQFDIQMFCDGANMNAMLGITRPGDQGFDCMHLNLHKTFSTPHGGGGPGCGAIGVKKHLEPFLPSPVLARKNDGILFFENERPLSIGKISSYYGHFLMNVRALAYLLAYGKEELHEIARHAVLNANYMMAKLKDVMLPAYDRRCMHECVLSALNYKQFGVRAIDISKRLIDYGFHPPTNYFPLIVPEAFMIEPTETESKETLDAFCKALAQICEEAKVEPELLQNAPSTQVVTRLDEAYAAKTLDVCWGNRSIEKS